MDVFGRFCTNISKVTICHRNGYSVKLITLLLVFQDAAYMYIILYIPVHVMIDLFI